MEMGMMEACPKSEASEQLPNTPPFCALGKPDWSYVKKPEMEVFDGRDWGLIIPQKRLFFAEHQALHILRTLRSMRDDPSYGYTINNYQHCLQSATMAMRDGHDEETIVVALLHDIGFTFCPEAHGAVAAAMLAPYVEDRHVWMLERHGIFQTVHVHEHPDSDPNERERWRGHPHFAWTAEYVARYDQNAIRPDYENAPLELFEPMVHRLLARPPRRVHLP